MYKYSNGKSDALSSKNAYFYGVSNILASCPQPYKRGSGDNSIIARSYEFFKWYLGWPITSNRLCGKLS